MKKLFSALFYLALIGTFSSVEAKVIEMNDIGQTSPSSSRVIDTSLPSGMPDPNNQEEVMDFFRERFATASVSYVNDLSDLNKVDSIDVQHSREYIEQMQQDNKSTFEKIYDRAIGRALNDSDQATPSNTVFYREADDDVRHEINPLEQPNIPVVNVTLPSGRELIAPAREHIPYLLASYNILPTGLIQVQEEITVVANGQKLKNGLVKRIQKTSESRSKVRKKIDFQLVSVMINGNKIPHYLQEIGDYIYIKPQKPYVLPSGVYNYSFEYLMDRKLWYYLDFSEFYVDVTGSYLNLLITSANAVISVPDGKSFMTQNVIVGSKNQFSADRAMIASLDSNALGFASVTPLLPGEGMHVLVSLDKNVFLEPDWNQRFVWFVTDEGDILFSMAGFAAILISYWLSWKYLTGRKKTGKTNTPMQSPAVLRYILTQKFDQRSFGALLLDMYRKEVIDFEHKDDEILIVKKSDAGRGLSGSEKKSLKHLFGERETVLPVSSRYKLKFARARKILEKGTRLQIKLLNLKNNIGYLFFSVAMLLLSEAAIAMLSVNPLQTTFILFSATVTIGFYIWMLKRTFKRKLLGYIVKFFAVLMIVGALLLTSIYIKFVSAFLIAAMVYVIFEFNSLFAKRGSLAKGRLQEVEELRKSLTNNAQTISKSQNFYARQPYVFALELDELYPLTPYIEQGYRLETMRQIVRILSA